MVFASLVSTTLSVTPGSVIGAEFETVSFVLSTMEIPLSPDPNTKVVPLAPGWTSVACELERAIVKAVNWSLLASRISIASRDDGLVTATNARFASLLTLGVLLEPPPQPT